MLQRDEITVKPYAAPLLIALGQVEQWLKRDGVSPVIVAAHVEEELDKRDWPAHIEVQAVKPLRQRVSARVSRSVREANSSAKAYQTLGIPSFVCVLRGRAVLRFADYTLSCRPADIVFIPQGVSLFIGAHVASHSPDSQCDLLWLRPDTSNHWFYTWICHSQGPLHESGPELGACRVESSLLERQFQNLSEELQGEKNAGLIHQFTVSVLGLLRREIEAGRAYLPAHHLADHHQPLTKNVHDPMELACTFIDEHLGQSLVEGRVARYLCISLTLFRRRFREYTGGTFHDFLTARRIQKASALLRETDIPVADISRLVGLHYSQFRRLYYRHYACSPGEYRKRARQTPLEMEDH